MPSYIVLINHADCGMTHLTNEAIRQTLKASGLGDEKAETFEFGEIKEYVTA